jgi:hypothetical protein
MDRAAEAKKAEAAEESSTDPGNEWASDDLDDLV